MGYYATGSITIEITEEQATQIALTIDEYIADNKIEEDTGDDNICQIFIAAYYETQDISQKTETDTTIHIYQFSYDGKWNDEYCEPPLHFLASHGAKITGNFRGEDDEAWIYQTKPGENKLITDYIVDVAHEDYLNMMKALQTLTTLKTELETNKPKTYTTEDILNIITNNTTPTTVKVPDLIPTN